MDACDIEYENILNNTDKIIPLERIRMKQSDIVDGYDKQDWDTNTGRCVFDYIIYRYGNIKGFKNVCNYEDLNKIFDDSILGEDKKDLLKIGVNTQEIKRFCEMYKIPMYAVDDNEKCFLQHIPHKRNKNAPAMIFRISNEHFYPCPNKKIQSIIQTTSIMNKINNSMVETYKQREHNKNKLKEGAFFPFYIKDDININLNEYQIFTKKTLDNNEERERNLDNCLLFSLKQYGIKESKLETIKNMVKQKHIPLKDLKMVCERLEICIVLYHYRDDNTLNKTRKLVYGNQYKEKVEIGYIENHYFIIKETQYTSYCIKNYQEVKDLENFNKIIRKIKTTYVRDDKRFLNSFDLIILMMEYKDQFFDKINAGNINIYDEEFDDKNDDNIFEDFLENNYNNILNETFEISNINDDICDINDDTIIASLRYNNIRDIKEDTKYCINYTSHLKDIKLKKYLEDFLFENHYKMIFKSGSLTDRFKNINSNICYNSIYRIIFNNNYNDTIKKYNILPLKCSNIVKLLHSIDPSITGSFIDYLIRRIICELLNTEFYDIRASMRLDNVNHTCNSEDCRYSIEFEYQDKEEVFNKNCTLPYCRLHSYNLTKLTNKYKTPDIIEHIFITSLSHGEAFGTCPNQDNVNKILDILKDNIFDLYTPLMILCKNIIKNKENIQLNPAFGGKLKSPVDNYKIPSDADLIINDCLIDIKCTKNKSNSKCCEILQLLGYSALSSFQKYNNKKINKIIILNILEGSIYKIDISNITDKNYENYIKFLCNEL
jgi:hypothetical protein